MMKYNIRAKWNRLEDDVRSAIGCFLIKLGSRIAKNLTDYSIDHGRITWRRRIARKPGEHPIDKLAQLRAAVKPFSDLVHTTSGRIPTEMLSFADWHALTKAMAQTGDGRE